MIVLLYWILEQTHCSWTGADAFLCHRFRARWRCVKGISVIFSACVPTHTRWASQSTIRECPCSRFRVIHNDSVRTTKTEQRTWSSESTMCCGLRHGLWCVQEISGDNVLGTLRLMPDVVLSTIWLLAIQCSISRTINDRCGAQLWRKSCSTHHRKWFTSQSIRFPLLCVPCQFRGVYLMRLPVEVSCKFKEVDLDLMDSNTCT